MVLAIAVEIAPALASGLGRWALAMAMVLASAMCIWWVFDRMYVSYRAETRFTCFPPQGICLGFLVGSRRLTKRCLQAFPLQIMTGLAQFPRCAVMALEVVMFWG